MTAGWIVANLWSYSAQIALVAVAGAIAAAWVGSRGPAARLLHWQFVLAACVLLPLAQHWKPASLAEVTIVTGPVIAAQRGPATQTIPWMQIAVGIVGTGVVVRLAWLAMGLIRLSLYRSRSQRMDSPVWPVDVEFRVSNEVSGPITFGVRRPVILLPPQYRQMPPDQQEAICLHELLHVERRDWMVVVVEELVRAILWFHPAVWWVLGQIQLAREETVDRAVIERTRSRESYLEALLAVAGGQQRADLAPAPLFLRRRQLAKRVESLMKEISMSTKQVVLSLSASLLVLVAAAGVAVSWLPLRALAQSAAEPQVQSGSKILHKAPVHYPPEAKAKGIQGSVVVEVLIDDTGTVADARVLSGPDELRRAALQSVLQWHFAPDTPKRAQVVIEFRLPADQAATPERKFVPLSVPRKDLGPLKRIDFAAVSPALRDSLENIRTIQEGDLVTTEKMDQLRREIALIDEHLRVGIEVRDGVTIRVRPPGDTDANPPLKQIRIGGNAQSANLISGVRPVYPPLAKQAKVQGTVQMTVTIARDGAVKNILLVSGHPLLAPAAMEAVRQWLYQPTLLNGEPVEVVTTVDVNFTLAE